MSASQQAVPRDDAPVPGVIANYAAYLRGRTHAEPEVTITGDHAEVVHRHGDKTLTLALVFRRAEWSPDRAEVRHGGQVTAFPRGKLAMAVTALLTPGP